MVNFFKKVSVVLTLLLLVGIVYFFNFGQKEHAVATRLENQALKMALIKCDGVAEKSVSKLVPIVEYQKLEKAGRQARVFKMCMNDHGYAENKQWLKYSTSVAEKIAKQTKISLNEALENLRRANMLYWLLQNQ
jgi:hypothetical protein